MTPPNRLATVAETKPEGSQAALGERNSVPSGRLRAIFPWPVTRKKWVGGFTIGTNAANEAAR